MSDSLVSVSLTRKSVIVVTEPRSNIPYIGRVDVELHVSPASCAGRTDTSDYELTKVLSLLEPDDILVEW